MGKVPINYCTYTDLLKVSGVGDEIARYILSLRKDCHGKITPQILSILEPCVQNWQHFCGYFDYTPYVSNSRTSTDTYPDYVDRHTSSADNVDNAARSEHSPLVAGGFRLYPHQPIASSFSPNRARSDSSPPREFQRSPSSVPPRNLSFQQKRDTRVYHSSARHASDLTKKVVSSSEKLKIPSTWSVSPEPISFDGNGSWNTFLAQFCYYTNKWSGRQLRPYLCQCLTGRARDYCKSLLECEPNMSFRYLVLYLGDEFAPHGNIAISKFNDAQQVSGESCSTWADRVLQLVAHAFPNQPSDLIRQLAIDKVCNGASDLEAGQYAADSHPHSLDEAIDLMRQFKYASRTPDGKSRKNVPQHSSNEAPPSESNRKVCSEPPSQPSMGYEKISEQVTKLEGVIPKFETKITSLEDNVHHLQNRVSSLEVKLGNRVTCLETQIDSFEVSFQEKMDSLFHQVVTLQNMVQGLTLSVQELNKESHPSCSCTKLDKLGQDRPKGSSENLVSSASDLGSDQKLVDGPPPKGLDFQFNVFNNSSPIAAKDGSSPSSPCMTPLPVDEKDVIQVTSNDETMNHNGAIASEYTSLSPNHLTSCEENKETLAKRSCVLSIPPVLASPVLHVVHVEVGMKLLPPDASHSSKCNGGKLTPSRVRVGRPAPDGSEANPRPPSPVCPWVLPPWPPPYVSYDSLSSC